MSRAFSLLWMCLVLVVLINAAWRRAQAAQAAKAAEESAADEATAQRARETIEELQKAEAEEAAAGWRPPTAPAPAPTPNIRPRVLPTGSPYPPVEPSPATTPPYPPVEPSPAPPPPVAMPAAAPAASTGDGTPSVTSGPQLIDLSPDLKRRALELMQQHYEVGAVRLVCDETGAGILDAQKTVRALAGLPTL